jgi:hypothetical protein
MCITHQMNSKNSLICHPIKLIGVMGHHYKQSVLIHPNSISHTYPVANAQYTITLEQTNPWGITRVSKTITTPFTDVVINNPNGEAFFIPAGGNWFETPISYDYIFSGDAVNVVSAQTSNNFTTVPFTVSGLTKSKLNELALYGPLKFQVGVPVIKNGQIWGAITNTATTFTAYTINLG